MGGERERAGRRTQKTRCEDILRLLLEESALADVYIILLPHCYVPISIIDFLPGITRPLSCYFRPLSSYILSEV